MFTRAQKDKKSTDRKITADQPGSDLGWELGITLTADPQLWT